MDLLSAKAPGSRLRPVQLVVVVAASLVSIGLFAGALALFAVAGTPWGPCDPSSPDCGPSRGTFVGASFLCGILGFTVLSVLVMWRRRLRVRPGSAPGHP